MHNFKVGDKVVVFQHTKQESLEIPIGTVGIINRNMYPHLERREMYVHVKFEDTSGYLNSWWIEPEDIKLYKKPRKKKNKFGYTEIQQEVVNKIQEMDRRFSERKSI